MQVIMKLNFILQVIFNGNFTNATGFQMQLPIYVSFRHRR